HSCMSQGTSTMHAKFYLFSQSGRSRWVSMISSANPYRGNTYFSWNNMHTIVGNRVVYDSLNKYFVDMLPDRTQRNYFRVTTSGKYRLYFYPGVSQRPNVWVDVLKHVGCTPGRGYGIRGRTRVRVAQWGWTTGRADVARELRALHSRGCNVEVILNKGRTNKAVFRELLKPTKRGKLKVWDAWYDGNKNGIASMYNHHKVMTIDGRWFGRDARVVYTGSQNLSLQAQMDNNDIILRILGDNRIHKAYMVNLNYMRDRKSRRIYTVPDNPKIDENDRVAGQGATPEGAPPTVSPEDEGFLKENAELEEFAEN
ncbi:MAG: phospholipase D-like domain-containing protein, partial [Actinomycetes bacterium]